MLHIFKTLLEMTHLRMFIVRKDSFSNNIATNLFSTKHCPSVFCFHKNQTLSLHTHYTHTKELLKVILIYNYVTSFA